MIIIPALTGIRNDVNKDETLHMTSEQASWFGTDPHNTHSTYKSETFDK